MSVIYLYQILYKLYNALINSTPDITCIYRPTVSFSSMATLHPHLILITLHSSLILTALWGDKVRMLIHIYPHYYHGVLHERVHGNDE